MKRILITAGLITAAFAAPAMAMDAKTYPYNASGNYCPAGLQPIVMAGVICCGTPNQKVSYSSMKAHPVARKHYYQAPRRMESYGSKSPTDYGSKSPSGY